MLFDLPSFALNTGETATVTAQKPFFPVDYSVMMYLAFVQLPPYCLLAIKHFHPKKALSFIILRGRQASELVS